MTGYLGGEELELAVGVVVGGPLDEIRVPVAEDDECAAGGVGFVEEFVGGLDDGFISVDQFVPFFVAIGVGDQDAERNVE